LVSIHSHLNEWFKPILQLRAHSPPKLGNSDMRLQSLVMLGLAIVFGGLSMLAGQRWLSRQAALQQPQVITVTEQSKIPMTTVVVAAQALRYGDEITGRNTKEVSWPADSAPPGVFRTGAELLKDNERRVVLATIEPNEPILPTKITGPGQRGTLSAVLEDGMGAVTIQVNEVIGLAGFVLPGDRVDVLLTRHDSGGDGGQAAANQNNSFTDVVLQNTRVLAVGQTADERANKPTIVSAVTIEVGPVGAQKIALASKAGVLSLMLRKAGETAARPGRRVALGELGQGADTGLASQTVTVRVARGMERKEYAVPVQGLASANTNVAGLRSAPPPAANAIRPVAFPPTRAASAGF
jgi:pilus assembly protein CpaB